MNEALRKQVSKIVYGFPWQAKIVVHTHKIAGTWSYSYEAIPRSGKESACICNTLEEAERLVFDWIRQGVWE